MNITPQAILDFINEEYKKNKTPAGHLIFESKQMNSARNYLNSLNLNEGAILSTEKIAELVNRMIPLFKITNGKMQVSATFVTLVKLVNKIMTEATDLSENTKEYLTLIQEFFGDCALFFDDNFSNQLKKTLGYLTIDLPRMNPYKRIEADSWIALHNAEILTPQTKNIISLFPSTGTALVLFSQYTNQNKLNQYKLNQYRETVYNEYSRNGNNRWLITFSTDVVFSICITGDIKEIMTLLKQTSNIVQNIFFIPVALNQEAQAFYQINWLLPVQISFTDAPPNAKTLNQRLQYLDSNYLLKIFQYLNSNHLLTENNIKAFLDPKISVLFKNEKLEQLLLLIPTEKRTQEVLNNIFEYCSNQAQANQEENLYTRLIVLLATKIDWSSHEQQAAWFPHNTYVGELKQRIINTLTKNHPLVINEIERQLHKSMLLWSKVEPNFYNSSCSRVTYDRIKKFECIYIFLNQLNSDEEIFFNQDRLNFLLDPTNDLFLRNNHLHELMLKVTPHLTSGLLNTLSGKQIWYALLRYNEQNNLTRRTYDLNNLYNLMSYFRIPKSIAYLLTPENDELIDNTSVKTMLDSDWFDYLLLRIPRDSFNQTVWDDLLRCATTESPEEAVSTYVNQLIHQLGENKAINLQSVHVPTIHESVTISLQALHQRYHTVREKEKIEQHIMEIDNLISVLEFIVNNVEENCRDKNIPFVDQCIAHVFAEENQIIAGKFRHIITELLNSLDEGKFDFKDWGSAAAIDGAARCLKRLKQIKQITEKKSGFSIEKILALVWEAILDKTSHKNPDLNALNRFIDELFNMQDPDGQKDNFACPSGSINDLLNPLNYLHHDVSIIMLDEVNVKRIVTEELGKHIEAVIHFLKNKQVAEILELVDYEAILSDTRQTAHTEVNRRLQEAKFNPTQIQQIKEIQTHYNKSINQVINEEIRLLSLNNYDYTRDLIIKKYTEKHKLPSQIKEPPKDDFEQLIDVIESAQTRITSPKKITLSDSDNGSHDEEKLDFGSTEREALAATSSTNVSLNNLNALYNSSIPNALIANFISILKLKDYDETKSWLEKNLNQLNKGIFGRLLKEYFFGLEPTKKPFNCKDLSKLAECVEAFGNQKISGEEQALHTLS